ncbi:MAG: hypothetical protein HEEMFOPI_01037 [Holosporales bacterium]
MVDALGISRDGIRCGNKAMETLAANMANSKAIAGKGAQYFMTGVTDGVRTTNGVSGCLMNNISTAGEAVDVDNPMYCMAGSNGFFVCDKGFTRVGTWQFDENGICANHQGNKLLAYQLDANGNRVNPNNTSEIISDNTTTNYMTHINKFNIRMDASATSTLSYAYQLPMEGATTGTKVITDATVYDSFGTAHNLTFTFTRAQIGQNASAQNVVVTPTAQQSAIPLNDASNIIASTNAAAAWFLTITPTNSASGDVVNAPFAASGNGMLIEFDSSGTPLSYNNSQLALSGNPANGTTTPPNLTTVYGNLAANGNISLDFGQAGTSSGIVCTGSKKKMIDIQANGNSSGEFLSLEWSKDGYGIVKFDNGLQQKKFLMAQAYFANANGLDTDLNGLYQQSVKSGNVLFDVPGSNNIGYLTTSSYEDANVSAIDTQIDMIENQQYFMGQTTAFKLAKELLEDLKRATG